MEGVCTHEEALAAAAAAQVAASAAHEGTPMIPAAAPTASSRLCAPAGGQGGPARHLLPSQGLQGGGSASGMRTPPNRGSVTGPSGLSTPPPRLLRYSAGRFRSPRSLAGARWAPLHARTTRAEPLSNAAVIDVDAVAATGVVDVGQHERAKVAAPAAVAADRAASEEVELVGVWVAPPPAAWVSAAPHAVAAPVGGGGAHSLGAADVARAAHPPPSRSGNGRRGVVHFSSQLGSSSGAPPATRVGVAALPRSVATLPPVAPQAAPPLLPSGFGDEEIQPSAADATPLPSTLVRSTPPRSLSPVPSSGKRRRLDARRAEGTETVTLEVLAALLKSGLASVRSESTRLRGELTIVKSQSASMLRRMDTMASDADADGGGLRNVLERLTSVERILADLQDRVTSENTDKNGQPAVENNKTVDMINAIKVSGVRCVQGS